MKKIYFYFLFLLISIYPIFAELYKIQDVSYNITGLTRQYSLTQKVPVDTQTVFSDYEFFLQYINDLKQELNNQRVFQTTDISFIVNECNSENIHPVSIVITTVDSINILGLPYPSYNSNTGLTLKLKFKDYNFLGSMETMDFDLNYQAKGTDNLENVTHVYGVNFGFILPFNLISVPALWNSDFSFSYTAGNSEIDMNICEGITVSIPISNNISADFSFNQYYIQDSVYISAHDDKYFKESFDISFPIRFDLIPNVSEIKWDPIISFIYIWDFDTFKDIPHGGLILNELQGPEFRFSNTISTEKVDWKDNFRDGYSCSLAQTYLYNVPNSSVSNSLIFTSDYYKKLCSFAGFTNRIYWYINFNETSSYVGPMLRGIRDKDWFSTDYLLFNLDLPLSLFTTDWGKFFGWDKLNFFNFEFQVSPFFDFAFGKNSWSQTTYSLKDGWYSTGFECIVFPERFRSIQGRISFGLDAVQFLQKADMKQGKSKGISNKLFNIDWRTENSSWYELTIGIGLFY